MATQLPVGITSTINLPAGAMVILRGKGVYRIGPLGASQRPTVDELIDDQTCIGPLGDACAVYVTPSGATDYALLPETTVWAPSDGLPSSLVAPIQRATITAALSATVARTAAAGITAYKARVAWNNNGANAAAKLRIAVNADNDVHGLMVGQSAKRRDHEMNIGDAVMLVCSVPITSLTFSADIGVTAGTHQLQVAFGN